MITHPHIKSNGGLKLGFRCVITAHISMINQLLIHTTNQCWCSWSSLVRYAPITCTSISMRLFHNITINHIWSWKHTSELQTVSRFIPLNWRLNSKVRHLIFETQILIREKIKICRKTKHSLHDDVIKWKRFPRYWPFVWIPLTKANDAELWCFLPFAPEQTVE